MRSLTARVSLLLLCVSSLFALQAQAPARTLPQNLSLDGFSDQFNENPLPMEDMARVGALQSVGIAEWLGPMAPIALSPFFGITCLAALSQYGGDLIPGNAFLSSNPVLNDPTVLWTFAILTVLTSLPRLTKVSKPLAQAIDQLETYAGIVTIVVIRIFASSESASPEIAMTEAAVIQMGFLSFTTDTLLSVAAIVNILVINGVKFFFEVMVWLTPFPFVDALLEVANKSLCALLMAIYVYSPTLATLINLVMFVACLFAWRWTQRRVVWLRSLLVDPIRAQFQPAFGLPKDSRLVVFAQDQFGPFPAKTRLELQPNEAGWQLVQRRFLFSDQVLELDRAGHELTIKCGILINRVEVQGGDSGTLLFTRRHSDYLPELGEMLAARFEPSGAGSTVTV